MGNCFGNDAAVTVAGEGGNAKGGDAGGAGRGMGEVTNQATRFRVYDQFVSAVESTGISAQRTFGTLFITDGQDADVTRSKLDDAFQKRVSEAETGVARLKVVCAAPLEEPGCDYKAPVHAKSQAEVDFLNDCLGENFLFEKLGSEEKRTLVDAFEKHSTTSGQTIIEQGEEGDYFYVIHKGKVKYEVGGKEVGKAGRGDTFGELALLYNCPRAATVTTLTECELWRVDQITFRRIISTHQIKTTAETKELLKKVVFLKGMEDSVLTKIACLMGTKTFRAGKQIAYKGEKLTTFFLVKSGKLKATDIEVDGKKWEDREYQPGDHAGAFAILKELDVYGNLVAVEDSTVLYLEKSDFIRMCGGYNELNQKSDYKKALQMVPISNRRLDASTAERMASIMVEGEQKYKEGHVFYSEGEEVQPGVYIIHSGEVKVKSSDGSTKTLGIFGVFGEETVSGRTLKKTVTSKHTVTATQDVAVGYLGARSIKSVLGDDWSEEEIKMEDLEKHRIVGAGTFGQVWLVSRKGTKDAYALKIQFKRQLIDSNQAKGIIREKNIMAKLNSDLIIKLVNTFQDDLNVYMVLKLYQGGELWTVLHSSDGDCLPEIAAKFYAGSVLEGLTYMHNRCILYRDLKPENVLLDSNGYTVIVDLGFAKVVPDKTYTFCGTPLYLAPEVILHRGHDKGADHWSWGVMLYEMLCGITPFFDKGIDQLTLFKRVVNVKYNFPDGDFISKDAKDLIRKILVVKPMNRLGSFARAEKDIQEHPWFHGFNFKKLHDKELTPPWQPKVTDPLDMSNFDNWDHLKDKKQEGKPLSEEEQKLFKDF